MKNNGIYIDYNNLKQVNWWNNYASKLVKVVRYNEIVEAATNKPVGVLMQLKGLFADYVIAENDNFIKNPTKMVIEVEL
jgi:hypothetical protein